MLCRLVLAANCLFLAATGCAPLDLRGNGFGDNTAAWGQKLRPPTKPGELQGIDQRAREIEQNLGVR